MGHPDRLVVCRVDGDSGSVAPRLIVLSLGPEEPARANIRLVMVPKAETDLLRKSTRRPHIDKDHIAVLVCLDAGQLIIEAGRRFVVKLVSTAKGSVDLGYSIQCVDAEDAD